MSSAVRGITLGTTSVAVAVIMVVAFLWVGPGVESFFKTASAATIFDEQQVIGVYERVSPAVVEVNTSVGSGSDLRRLGTGSGFLIDSDGHIVTNNHVIDGATSVRVIFSGGADASARVVGRNPANDLALLKVDASVVEGIVPVTLGDSATLKPGQLAIAIGNPFGLQSSVTIGVISQLGRDLTSDLSRPIASVIQTDALINPGNSGGPLLDSTGAVVGINTAMQVSPSGEGVRGIGFAVPVDTLDSVLPSLKEGGIVRPPWLGIQGLDLDPTLAERLGLAQDSGVYVTGVMPDSPADEAGLMESGLDSTDRPTGDGDIITAVDGVDVDTTAELVAQLNTKLVGDQVTLTVVRGGESQQVTVTLGEWPEDPVEPRLPRFEERRRHPQPDVPEDFFRRFFPSPDGFHDSPCGEEGR